MACSRMGKSPDARRGDVRGEGRRLTCNMWCIRRVGGVDAGVCDDAGASAVKAAEVVAAALHTEGRSKR